MGTRRLRTLAPAVLGSTTARERRDRNCSHFSCFITVETMTPLPIALFVDRYAPGGTQRQIIELLKRIDRRRFRIFPVCFHADGQWFDQVAAFGGPIDLFPIHGFRRPATLYRLFSFARWCRANRIAVMHSWDIYSNVFGLTGAAMASVPVRIGS